jgi:hypothetical protein
MDNINGVIGVGNADVHGSNARTAARSLARARTEGHPFGRRPRATARAGTSKIETVCERARETAHGVLIGAIPGLGQAV